MTIAADTWALLGAVPPQGLVEARLALHYAAQPLAAAAYALLPPEPDHAHSNLLWSPRRRGFLGRPLPGGRRAFLDPVGLRTGLLEGEGQEVASLPLAGRTLDEALAQMSAALRRAGERVPGELRLPTYDLPAASIAAGAAFPAPDAPALEELARWFHDASLVLSGVAQSALEGAEVRGWPHHFDLAALLTLDPDRDAESARSLNVGFSPGDEQDPQPYFYVTPWPAPETSALPALPPDVRWNTQGYVAAILAPEALLAAGDARAQQRKATESVSRTVSVCLRMLAP